MSKQSMYKKLQCVQSALMEETIEDYSLQSLLPLIFKYCSDNNITFWFNFIEDHAVLNLRDVSQENMELNIRYSFRGGPVLDVTRAEDTLEFIKVTVLKNAFLLTDNPVKSIEITSSDDVAPEEPIIKSETVPPTSIRTVIDMLQKNGEPVNKRSIQKYLQLDKMSSDNRSKCIAYLKSMEE